MDLFTYLMNKNGNNVPGDLFSSLLGKGQSGTYQTFTGTSINANNTKKGKMKVNLLGNTSQTGTPTPSSPIPVNVVSGDNTIVSTGKNLVEAIITHTNISAEGKIVYHYDYDLHIAKIVQGKTYTMTTTAANDKVLGFFINYPTINSNTYNNSRVIQSSYTFTAPITGYVAFRSSTGYAYAQCEVGSTATTYEPYTSTSYPIHLGDKELCKIGNYQDRFFKNIPNTTDYKSDLEDNEWYLEKKIGKVVLDGSETWYRWTANTFYITKLTEIRNALSNYYTYNSTATGGGQLSNGEFFIHDSTNNNVVIFKNTGINDSIDSFKNWLSTHNTIVYYVLSSPTYTQITGTLKDELEAVWRANSYNGTTNISQVNNDLPFNMDVSVKVGN